MSLLVAGLSNYIVALTGEHNVAVAGVVLREGNVFEDKALCRCAMLERELLERFGVIHLIERLVELGNEISADSFFFELGDFLTEALSKLLEFAVLLDERLYRIVVDTLERFESLVHLLHELIIGQLTLIALVNYCDDHFGALAEKCSLSLGHAVEFKAEVFYCYFLAHIYEVLKMLDILVEVLKEIIVGFLDGIGSCIFLRGIAGGRRLFLNLRGGIHEKIGGCIHFAPAVGATGV